MKTDYTVTVTAGPHGGDRPFSHPEVSVVCAGIQFRFRLTDRPRTGTIHLMYCDKRTADCQTAYRKAREEAGRKLHTFVSGRQAAQGSVTA